MIQYLSQFTINDIIAVYCTGLLSIIFAVASFSLIMVLIVNLVSLAYDFIIKTQYEMKRTKRYYQEQAIQSQTDTVDRMIQGQDDNFREGLTNIKGEHNAS